MKLVGAAFRDDVHLRTMTTSEFRCGNAGLHGELLDSVGDAEVAERGVELGVHVRHAVEQEEIRL